MSAAPRGLGRGLDALLGSPADVAPRGLREIGVDTIRPNARQPRTIFDAAGLAELEASIRELGVLVPVIVRPVPGSTPESFELIAGERRWRAATAARLATIPAIVRDADDGASLELAIVENLQRQDLDPLEEAMGLQHLMDEYRFTQERLAERIGKSRPSVANALRLLALSDSIKALLRSGVLTVGHARALLAIEPAQREVVATRIARDGLTVRDVERLGERRKRSVTVRTGTAPNRPDLEAVESRLRYALGAPVAIVPSAKGGRLEVRYVDEADLTRIVDAILPPDS